MIFKAFGVAIVLIVGVELEFGKFGQWFLPPLEFLLVDLSEHVFGLVVFSKISLFSIQVNA